MWSAKARHTLNAMEGDSEKTKISYFHHWIYSEGTAKIESWKNKKILISLEDYEKLEENEKKASAFQKRLKLTSHCLNLCKPPSQIHYWLQKNYALPSKVL